MKTDTQVQLDVVAELKYEPSVNATHIGVTVSEGIVSLFGQVDHYSEKMHAEMAIQRVSGVKGLAMEIEVKLPSLSKRSDSDIAHSIDNIISWSTLIPKEHIHIKVEDGWVTLSGHVKWNYQKLILTGALAHLLGVTGVSDQIAIKHDLAKSVVKNEIVLALNRRAQSEAKNITIDIKDGEVTLSGTVNSWNERSLVNHAAWSNAGVTNVIDKLTLVG
jgi:osmotically-inducible protein OsmY